MKTKLFLTCLLAVLFSLSHAQFDIPPGGIPGWPPDNSGCPPGAWCHPDGAGMSIMSDDDIDAVNDALEDPEGCCCGCALGKWFLDLIRPAYPDCYPNCNLESTSSSSSNTSSDPNIDNAPQFAAKGEISTQTYSYFFKELPQSLKSKEGAAVALKGVDGLKFKLAGMWVYNEKESSEFRVLCIEPVDNKTGASYDRLYLTFTKKSMVIMNQSFINAKSKGKGKGKKK